MARRFRPIPEEENPFDVGTSVRATQQIENGYGAQRRIIEPGQSGTVVEFSRHLNLPRVEWDDGTRCLCKPETLEIVAAGGGGPGRRPARVYGAEEVAVVVRAAVEAQNGSRIPIRGVDDGELNTEMRLRLANGQTFAVRVREEFTEEEEDEEA